MPDSQRYLRTQRCTHILSYTTILAVFHLEELKKVRKDMGQIQSMTERIDTWSMRHKDMKKEGWLIKEQLTESALRLNGHHINAMIQMT